MPSTVDLAAPNLPLRTLEEFSRGGRDNNFNLLRFSAASLVILTHAFGLTGSGELEPLKRLAGVSLGSWAVDVFFAVSGFLITKSWDRRRDPVAFFYARFMRIYPALWVAVIACAFIVGPLFTNLPMAAYFRNLDTAKFLVSNTTLLPFGIFQTLPGVFAGNPSPSVNSPLWTLPYELKMYVALAALGMLGALRLRWAVLLGTAIAFVAFCAAWLNLLPASGHQTEMLRCTFSFFAGTSAYLFRGQIVLTWRRYGIALACMAILFAVFRDPLNRRLVLAFFTPALALPLAFLPAGWIRNFNRLGDYSYGIYIFGNPVQQILLALTGVMSTAFNFFCTYAITLLLAVASWHLLEHRASKMPMPRFLCRVRDRIQGLPFVARSKPGPA